jgi:Resolvase, N terminal domain
MEELMSPSIRRFVAYYRVSTARQGRSGLGLEAQKDAVLAFINGHAELVAEFTEVESGKHADREELKKAIAACKKHKAKLVIAKLDRLIPKLADPDSCCRRPAGRSIAKTYVGPIGYWRRAERRRWRR